MFVEIWLFRGSMLVEIHKSGPIQSILSKMAGDSLIAGSILVECEHYRPFMLV